jgi:hypothetical protein
LGPEPFQSLKRGFLIGLGTPTCLAVEIGSAPRAKSPAFLRTKGSERQSEKHLFRHQPIDVDLLAVEKFHLQIFRFQLHLFFVREVFFYEQQRVHILKQLPRVRIQAPVALELEPRAEAPPDADMIRALVNLQIYADRLQRLHFKRIVGGHEIFQPVSIPMIMEDAS